jgi:hypothetical protein
MVQSLPDRLKQQMAALSERHFEFKAFTVQSNDVHRVLHVYSGAFRNRGWMHIGHIRSNRLTTIFYARLLPAGLRATSHRQFQFESIVTFRLPGKKVLERYRDWEPLLTKRWSSFEKDVPSDFCVAFFVRRRSRKSVAV